VVSLADRYLAGLGAALHALFGAVVSLLGLLAEQAGTSNGRPTLCLPAALRFTEEV